MLESISPAIPNFGQIAACPVAQYIKKDIKKDTQPQQSKIFLRNRELVECTAMDAYIGQGFGFPLKINVQGNVHLSAAAQNLDESIHLILRTEIGERVYRPDFGSRLAELVFAPLNTQTLLLLRLYVEEALEAWEPRIELEEILADPDPVAGRVDITIRYRPTGTYDLRSLVYPFYLLPAAETE